MQGEKPGFLIGYMMPEAWRDIDSDYRKFGVVLWRGGGSLYIGKKMYRWVYRKTPISIAKGGE